MAKGENPAMRSKRYARELKSGKNEFTGKPLTNGQRSFRGGVLNERKWGASIFKHKNANKKQRTTAKKQVDIKWSNYRSNDFDYDEHGNIEGHFVDGKFEPD